MATMMVLLITMLKGTKIAKISNGMMLIMNLKNQSITL